MAAPTTPCSTGPSDADAYATLPSLRVGWWWNVPPRPRSKRIAPGTIGTTWPGRADRPAVPVGEQALDDAVGRGETEEPPPAEHDGVDAVDEVARVEQVGLPRARSPAADVHAADGAAVRGQDHRGPGQPARVAAGRVADLEAGDVGERVRGAGLERHAPQARASASSADLRRRAQTLMPRRRALRARCREARSRRSRLTSIGSASRASGVSISALSTW